MIESTTHACFFPYIHIARQNVVLALNLIKIYLITDSKTELKKRLFNQILIMNSFWLNTKSPEAKTLISCND